MPKNFFEDMVRIKREKNGIPFDAPSQVETPVQKTFSTPKPKPKPMQEFIQEVPEVEEKSFQNKFASVYDVADSGNIRTSRYGIWWVAGVAVLFLLFALSYLFAGAKVVITPKVKDVVLNQSLSAVKDASEDELSFDLVVLSGEETKTVMGGEEQDVFKRSKGRVVIYNNYSTAAQKLDVDTRLEGSNGKIYKTENKVTVPGKSKTGTPGSIEVGIYASEPGAEYDSAPLDFKIFGFKGTPKYAKFYARSKDKIVGGFKGKVKAVSEADKAAALTELKTTLEEKLSKKANDQIPAGFVLFKQAGFLDTEEVPVTTTVASAEVPITVKGTFYGVLFDEKKITQQIAKDMISNYTDEDVYIPNMRDVGFTLANKDISLKDTKTLAFTLSGDAKLVYKVDAVKFKQDILGKAKKDFNKILATYGSIDSATLTIRPIWKMSFPDKEKNISVTITEPN